MIFQQFQGEAKYSNRRMSFIFPLIMEATQVSLEISIKKRRPPVGLVKVPLNPLEFGLSDVIG